MKSFIVAAVVGLVSATVIAAPASAGSKRGGGFNPAMLATMAPVAIAAGTVLIESGAIDTSSIGSSFSSTPAISSVPSLSSGLPVSIPGIQLPSRIRNDIGG